MEEGRLTSNFGKRNVCLQNRQCASALEQAARELAGGKEEEKGKTKPPAQLVGCLARSWPLRTAGVVLCLETGNGLLSLSSDYLLV